MFGRGFRGRAVVLVLASMGCGGGADAEDGHGTGSAGSVGRPTTITATATGTTGAVDDAVDGQDGPAPGCDPAFSDCADKLDVLIIVDDGPTMVAEQGNVARNFVAIAREIETLLDSDGSPAGLSTNVMVTRASVGSPLCAGPAGGGAPITTACIDRLGDFTSLATGDDTTNACLDVCPQAVAPPGAFVWFHDGMNNVALPVDLDLDLDLDGDGMPESEVARALACIGPQGIAGCPYGSPLEAMRLALDPAAAWNTNAAPFLRPDAALLIFFIGDGIDCSGADATTLEDASRWEVDPTTGLPAPSEALCWHAAVACEGPDATGTFQECTPTPAPLTPAAEYLTFLEALRDATNKTIILAGAVGVPPVTDHRVESPYEPTAGGMHALEVRQWRDTDLTPADLAAGRTIADKQFELGVGPACTGLAADGDDVVGQAIPSLRVVEVCRGFDASNEDRFPRLRCCMESICGEDLTPALDCLGALLPPIYAE